MEDSFNSSSSNRFYFTESYGDTSRTHYYGGSSNHGDKMRKLQLDNDHLKERVRTCERSLGTLYQLIHKSNKPLPSPRGLIHNRSASLTYRSRSGSNSMTPSPIPELYSGGMGMDPTLSPHLVTFPDLKEAIESLVSERDSLFSEMDDLKQRTEAAKRERVLAIDEKDQMLRDTHVLKVTVEKMEAALKEADSERVDLTNQIQDLKEEMMSLRRANEEARKMQSVALEERSKVIEDYTQLKHELQGLQREREELFEETLQLQSSLQDLTNEKRKLLSDMDWLSKRSSGYEAVARTLKEQNEVLHGRACDTITVTLERTSVNQPWGFSIQGGLGNEFYRHDPSIVVTGIADRTPATGVLKFGDRILSVGGHNFRNVTRKEAAEKLRSCDQSTVTIEIARVTSQPKSPPQEIRIPGKKAFGFSYESRLFVSAVSHDGAASQLLTPGDEIVKVMGKTAVNMKSSHLKQLLKSCKDGLTLTIQRSSLNDSKSSPPLSSSIRVGTSHPLSMSSPHQTTSIASANGGRTSQHNPRSSSEFHHSNQVPGTPGSTISGSSAGYYSLTHSMPSMLSNVLSPDLKTTPQTASIVVERGVADRTMAPPTMTSSSSLGQPSTSVPATNTTSGYDSLLARYRSGSSTSSASLTGAGTRSNLRSRPLDVYPPSSRRSNPPSMFHPSRGGPARTRTTSQTSYGTSMVSPGGPRSTETTRFNFKGSSLPRGSQPPSSSPYLRPRKQVISMSVDNLDSESCFPQTTPTVVSRDSHMTTPSTTTPTYYKGAISMSMGSMQTHV